MTYHLSNASGDVAVSDGWGGQRPTGSDNRHLSRIDEPSIGQLREEFPLFQKSTRSAGFLSGLAK
jgi:hypothetical protein